MLTMIADLRLRDPGCDSRDLPGPLERLAVERVEEVGELYFRSYDPGSAWDTLDECIGDIAASLRGAYGDFLSQASFIAQVDAVPVGAILTVLNAPWRDAPSGPFVIELFVAPDDRRQGHARSLLHAAGQAVACLGYDSIALRVNPDNRSAVSLYRSLGFEIWSTVRGLR